MPGELIPQPPHLPDQEQNLSHEQLASSIKGLIQNIDELIQAYVHLKKEQYYRLRQLRIIFSYVQIFERMNLCCCCIHSVRSCSMSSERSCPVRHLPKGGWLFSWCVSVTGRSWADSRDRCACRGAVLSLATGGASPGEGQTRRVDGHAGAV